MAKAKPQNKLVKVVKTPFKFAGAIGRGLRNAHVNLGRTKAGDLTRRAIYTGALLAAINASPHVIGAANRISDDHRHPAPAGFVKIETNTYLPHTLVLPHPNQMTYPLGEPFKYTGVENASRLVNQEINRQVYNYRKNPDYALAAKHIDPAFIHAIFSTESRYHPGAYYPGDNKGPTDVGLGQVTQPALEQAKQDGILPQKITRVEELMTLVHPSDWQAEKTERSYYNPNKKLLEQVYQREINALAQKLGKTREGITRKDIAKENRQRMLYNVRAAVHTAFSNAQGFLEKVDGRTNPNADLKRFLYLSYKDGAKGTAEQYFAEGKPGRTIKSGKVIPTQRTPHDNRYTVLRHDQTVEARQNMRYAVPRIENPQLPLAVNLFAATPFLGFKKKWEKTARKQKQQAKRK